MTSVFTTKQATFLASFDSPHMINYLIRNEIIEPSVPRPRGKGKKRLFTFGDVVRLKLIRKILDQKISVKHLKKAIQTSRDLKLLSFSDSGIFSGENPVKYMVSDGKNLYFKKNHKGVINLTLGGQMAFSFMLDLDQIHQEISKKAASKKFKKIA